jgi:glyoxylase I family protein
MAVLSFSHPGICVSDLERSTRFYVDVLGFAELFTMDFTADELAATMERPGAFSSRMLRRDDLRLELLHWHGGTVTGDGCRGPMDRRGLTHLCFRVDDVTELWDVARAAGGQVHPTTLTQMGAVRTVYLTDPDGVRIELISGMPELG